MKKLTPEERAIALLQVRPVLQEIEDDGPEDETERAMLMVEVMINAGILDREKWGSFT